MLELNKIHSGLCLDLIKKIDDKSIDCIITSPPYWQLRDYGYPEQWGLEPTYQEYLEHLWGLMDKVKRVLKPTGTAWINLGDTYGTISGGTRGLQRVKKGGNTISKKNIIGQGFEQKKPKRMKKCLLLIPHRFAIGCIDRGWIMRNDIIWAKPNAMPESVTDRFSKKHEYFFFMAKNQKYYFDLDSIREPYAESSIKRSQQNGVEIYTHPVHGGKKSNFINEKGKNPGTVSDFWAITTKGSSDKHYATFNSELIDKCIISGCPKDGIILDPFAGTATTGVRALQLDRKFIGIEASNEYYKIAEFRLKSEINQMKLF